MPPKFRVDLYYDIISPYAWINFEAWLRYAKKWPVDLNLRPFYLPGIFQKTGNIPPISIPHKNEYLEKDLERLNEYWGTGLVWHEKFRTETLKKSSIYAQRFLGAVQLYEQDKLIPASRAFWRRGWVDKQSVYTDQDVLEVAKSIGLKCEKRILGSLKTEEVKNHIIDNTNHALADKTLGLPYHGPLKELADST
ncbi:unnamed protein product, partial [Mesorhabditis spiculigera]